MDIKQIAELSKKNQPGIMEFLPDPSAPYPYIGVDRSTTNFFLLWEGRQETKFSLIRWLKRHLGFSI